jgi:hypothetical protein
MAAMSKTVFLTDILKQSVFHGGHFEWLPYEPLKKWNQGQLVPKVI